VLGEGAVFSFTLPVFSLPELIAPALLHGIRGDRALALLIAELGTRTGWLSSEARAEYCERVRDLLEACLHSDRDVLLPKMGSAGASELFFMVVVAEASDLRRSSSGFGSNSMVAKGLCKPD
jgi:hypothetical protein